MSKASRSHYCTATLRGEDKGSKSLSTVAVLRWKQAKHRRDDLSGRGGGTDHKQVVSAGLSEEVMFLPQLRDEMVLASKERTSWAAKTVCAKVLGQESCLWIYKFKRL